jgi:hypothetical protein
MGAKVITEFKVGDVVEVGGMRGIVRAERNGKFRVSAGRTDLGIWVDSVDMTFMYRRPDGDEHIAHIEVGTVTVQRCSSCGSSEPHHVEYVALNRVCVS